LGGAEAASGVHHRAEYEVPVDYDDPTTWPESRVRDLALQLSGGRQLHELFSLDQERHLRVFYADGPQGPRQVAELSLDVVRPGHSRSQLYYELELELLDQGKEADLQVLTVDLKEIWGLRPMPRSKFERSLDLVDAVRDGDGGERSMVEPLTTGERATLQKWLDKGNRPEQRRARIILLHDEGHGTGAIADKVGLSTRQVRRWVVAFREERMGIFPIYVEGGDQGEAEQPRQGESLIATEPGPDAIAFGTDKPAIPASLSIEDLCVRNKVDMGCAGHVRTLALQLFDLTADVHQLPPGCRSLLDAAAVLHDSGRVHDLAQRHLVARDLILAQPISGFEDTERDMLANVVAFHRKKVRRGREEALERLPAALQQETLALAALLRMAVGLNVSETQSTSVSRHEAKNSHITVVVDGPEAEKDAAAAERLSSLWGELFDVGLSFMTEEQLTQVSLVIDFGREEVALPELIAPGLLPDDPMSEAGRKILWFHFLRMIRHEPGTRAGEDIEELHDMRVATRRMRAAMRVFGDFFEPEAITSFNKGIRRVTRALGPVRDLDVFEEKAGHYLGRLPEAAKNGLDPLLETWRKERKGAREKMIAFLESDRYKKFKREFGEFLQIEGAGARPIPRDRPVPYQVRHVAPRLIYTRYETVRAYETILHDAQIEMLHALRIDCKYLRYTLEFLREVLGPEGEAVIKEVKVMQDHLGDLNDADVAIHLLNEFLRDWDATEGNVPLSQRRSVEGVVTYLAARHAEKHRLLTTFPEAWARLNRVEVRRWLALAVVAL
jgi:CHAD domain-containing protein